MLLILKPDILIIRTKISTLFRKYCKRMFYKKKKEKEKIFITVGDTHCRLKLGHQ